MKIKSSGVYKTQVKTWDVKTDRRTDKVRPLCPADISQTGHKQEHVSVMSLDGLLAPDINTGFH